MLIMITFPKEKHAHDLLHLVQILILLSLTAALASVLRLRRNAKKALVIDPPLPPGPRGLPLVGYLPFLSPYLYEDFSKLATVYGPIFKFWMGNKLGVVVTSAPLVKEVVRDQDVVFANRGFSTCGYVATHGGHDIAFAPYGPEWKKLRKIFVREMSNNTVLAGNLSSLRREEVKKSIRQIYKDMIDTPVDIRSLAFQMAINSVISMTISASEGDNAIINVVEFQKAVEELLALIGKLNVSDVLPAIARFDIQGIEKDTRKITLAIEAIFDYAIAKRNENAKNHEAKEIMRKDFLQVLLELHHEHEDHTSETSISMPEIKALLMDALLGATDTTTTVVEWTMTEILKHPEIMSKVQEELTQIVGLNNNVEEVHLSKLNYLNAVVKETFRLHPPLPLLVPRCPSQSAIVGGYLIPKGCTVFLNVWAIQRDPSVWENPLEFQPERFLMTNAEHQLNHNFSGNNFSYFPFGAGRRICAGVSLGEKMLMLMLASMLHSFEWKLPLGANLDLSNKSGMIIKKKEPLLSIPTPRLSHSLLHI
ncbi:Cytochrome P450 93A1 [Morus notabilis]|uniref:Cytochrome P450 93A1 n=1 Tax=Morus notabilis TaxID=981085 RepID=W9SVJ3_9ROSA|nr:cytochrome P450 93A3 [Morus notabilis]EXC29954.1 Cytochrome P450 93A1 [Morus notabilis]